MRKLLLTHYIVFVLGAVGLLNVFTSLPLEALVYVTVTATDPETGQNTSHVSVIDTSSNTVVETIPVGPNPADVAITPDGTRAYVANTGSGTVSVIDTTTNTLIDTDPNTSEVDPIIVGGNPRGVAITPNGTRAYVTDHGPQVDGIVDFVFVIDTETNTPIDTDPSTPAIDPITVGFTPDGLAITPDGARVYVANFGNEARAPGGTVSVINTASNTVVADIIPKDDFGNEIGKNPRGVAITPDGTRVYVTYDTDTPVANPGPVNVIDNTATPPEFTATIPQVGVDLSRIAITPDGSRAYVTVRSSDSVVVIDIDPGPGGSVIESIQVGNTPLGIAITADGTRAYVANATFGGSGTVSVIDTTTNTVIATIEVGGDPSGVAVTPDFSITQVTIDIKPGSDPNSIKLGSEGNVPVAIFSTPEFDATTVDPLTVTLASAPVKLKGNGTPQSSFEDVDGDGLLDQVVHVDTTALELSETDEEAILEGETTDGVIQGVDTVRVIE